MPGKFQVFYMYILIHVILKKEAIQGSTIIIPDYR